MFERPANEQDAIRERILGQHTELMRSANALANKIRSFPRDPSCPDIEPRAYLVGGFVRDAVLGKQAKDADMEVYGVSQERLEDALNQLFEGRVNAVGRAFAVYKVNLGEGVDFDVSMPRRESATGPEHTDIEVTGDPTMTPREASRRRDFTVNAMLADPLTGEVIDPYHGLEDLASHTLRAVDAQTFVEDPLRAYRAFRFCATLGLKPDEKTEQLLRDMAESGLLDHLSKERMTGEIQKLLLAPQPSVGFELMKRVGHLERRYPELAVLERTPQDSIHHPEGNVWIHTMMVVDKASELSRDPFFHFTDEQKIRVLLGALCHDLGKPETTEEADGRIHAYHHEEQGVAPAKRLLSNWSFGTETDSVVLAIVKHHATTFQLSEHVQTERQNEKQFTNSVRRLLRDIAPCQWQELVAVSESDTQGRTGDELEHAREASLLRARFNEAAERIAKTSGDRKTLITGQDVLSLGIPSGKRIGEIIKTIETMRDEDVIETREEALAELKRIAGNTLDAPSA